MLLIRCPYCDEERPELEFRNAGEAHVVRSSDMASISDDDFEKFFFIRANPKGIIFERWRHIHGCARFFNAARDTVTDKFLTTYKAGEPKPDIDKLAPKAPQAQGNLPSDEPEAKKPVRRKAGEGPERKKPRRAPAKKKGEV